MLTAQLLFVHSRAWKNKRNVVRTKDIKEYLGRNSFSFFSLLGQQSHSARRALPVPKRRDPLPLAHLDQLPHVLPGQRDGGRGQTAAVCVRVGTETFGGDGDEWKQIDRVRDSCDAGPRPGIFSRGGLQWIGGECARGGKRQPSRSHCL